MNLDDEIREIPLFLKAEEIYILIDKLPILVQENSDKEDHLNSVLVSEIKSLKESAFSIAGYIINSYKENIYYHIRMQSAANIRCEANFILSRIDDLEMFGFKELDYLELIKKAVEEFRILFIEWVKSFNDQLYVIDKWGLFNPPGVNHDDFDINRLKGEGCYSPFDDFDFEGLENLYFDDDGEDEDEDDDEDQSYFDSLFNDKD